MLMHYRWNRYNRFDIISQIALSCIWLPLIRHNLTNSFNLHTATINQATKYVYIECCCGLVITIPHTFDLGTKQIPVLHKTENRTENITSTIYAT